MFSIYNGITALQHFVFPTNNIKHSSCEIIVIIHSKRQIAYAAFMSFAKKKIFSFTKISFTKSRVFSTHILYKTILK